MRTRAVVAAVLSFLVLAAGSAYGEEGRRDSRRYIGPSEMVGSRALCAAHDGPPLGMDIGGTCFRIGGMDRSVRITVLDENSKHVGGTWRICFANGGCLPFPHRFCHTFTIGDLAVYGSANILRLDLEANPSCSSTSDFPTRGLAVAEFSRSPQ